MYWLDAATILHIHDRLIQETGGSLGLREPGLLAAIAEKPQASFGGQDLYPTIYDQAAALFEALCNYHVFVDGNKRTALTCLEYFLHANGLEIIATAIQREVFTLKIATSQPDLAEVATWIERHSRETTA